MSNAKNKKTKVINAYVKIMASGIFRPTLPDLKKLGITREVIRHNFGNMTDLRNAVKESKPGLFAGQIDLPTYLSDKNLKAISKRIKSNKRYFITTAVAGQEVPETHLASVKRFCLLNKAKLVILPSHDPAHNLDKKSDSDNSGIEWIFDAKIRNEDIIFEELRLNSNLFISGIRVTAKQINPITGLSELSQQKGSFIFASPKQSLEYDAVSANKLPHARMTTGAISLPNYNTTRGNSLRTAYIAEFQHVMGGLIVEIEDNEVFHHTQIQFDKDGSFCHMGYQYSGKGATKSFPTFVMGDLHAGNHDIDALNCWKRIIDHTGAKTVVLHDVFDGESISHWTMNNIMKRAENSKLGTNSLIAEANITSETLDEILSLKSIKKGIVVASNHDDFIDRYLQRGGFINDPINFKIGCQLAAEVVGTKKNALEQLLLLTKKPKHYDKLQFLTTEDDYMIGGVNVGVHGDKGANGSKGSIRSLSKALSKAIVGHSHSPGKHKNITQMGTTSHLRAGFNKGPSSWVHCSALLYDNGQVQLLNSIFGKSFI